MVGNRVALSNPKADSLKILRMCLIDEIMRR